MPTRPSRSAEARTVQGSGRVLVLGSLVVLVAAAVFAWLYVKHEQAEGRQAAEETLAAVADLKVTQITRWRQERLGDARQIYHTPHAVRQALDTMAQPGSATTRQMFTGWLDTVLAGGHYDRAFLLDDQLNVRLVHPESPVPLAEEVRATAAQALHSREVMLGELHRDSDDDHQHLTLVIPLVVRLEGSTEVVPAAGLPPSPTDRSVGLLLLQIHANESLFPMVQDWPTPSPTAETLLMRLDGQGVLFLNHPRHLAPTNTAILRLPLVLTNLPPALAVKGRKGQAGTVSAVDYRGERVVAAFHPVPGASWFIVAKVDQSEIFARLRTSMVMTLAVVGLLLLAVLLAFGLIWRQQAVAAARRELRERRQIETALRESERFARSTLDSLSAHIAILDDQGTVLAVNQTWRRFAEENPPNHGSVCEGANYLATCDAVKGEETVLAHEFAAGIRRVLDGKEQEFVLEYPCHSPTEQRWFLGRVTRFAGEKPVRVVVAHENITRRKHAEAALRGSEERFRRAVVDSPFPILLHAEDGEILQASNSWCEITGYTHAELATIEDWTERAYGNRKAVVQADIDALYALEHRKYEGDYVIRTRGGSSRTWEFSSAPLGRLPDGRRVVISMALDVTERRESEAALRASEERYRLLTENSADAILLTVLEGNILQANPAACRMFGRSEDELAQCDRASLVCLDDPRLPAVLEERARTGRFVGELTLRRRDGSPFPAEMTSTVFTDQEGRQRTSTIIRDLTERKRLEEERKAMEVQSRQQQRLESLGILAGGVAHEINNPITGIMNYAQLIQDHLLPESPLIEFSQEIIHETERVAGIVRNLLTFARTEKQSHSPARMADIVHGVLTLIRTVIRHDDIVLTVNVPQDLPTLLCRTQQIQQVLMNLLTNARDALNERYPRHDANKAMSLTAGLIGQDGSRWVRVTVEDHGTGISPEVRERMFDPFFTTKPRDVGTGLGLSISHGIVKEHGGRLAVESEPGQFTRMHLDLPIGTE